MTFEQHANGRSRDKDPNRLANMPETPQPQKRLTSKDDASDADIKTDAPDSKKVNKTIFAVGGSKGGVGKSALAANLAVGLSLLGQKVVLADLDLGGADVHLYVGVKSLTKTWNDFLDKKVASIKDILTPTAFEGLSLIGGDSSKLGSENLPYSQKQKILRHLRELEGDFLILDLGGNSSYNVLDFFLFADHKIVVSGSEPASILDSYSFVKVTFYRFLERFFSEYKSLKDLGRQIKDGSLEQAKNLSMDYFYEQVRQRDIKAYMNLKQRYEQFHVSLVVNMADHRKDFNIAKSMQQVLKEKCFLNVGVLGTIPYDKLARKAARNFTPIIVDHPRSKPSKVIHQMLAAILLDHENGANGAELLQKTKLIRGEAKDRIRSDMMTLDGLTVSQINSIYDQSPKLRQSFRKILNIMTT
ncbi:MAG: P-loop NTPase [Desulfobacterales bacterium]|jgi:flagellar biosynthesis protein FlhG